MSAADIAVAREADEDDLRDLRDLYLSRLMFNQFVGWPPETRTFDEFCRDALAREDPA